MHIQVIFQEITALCVYIYVFFVFWAFLLCFNITLFCNYPNSPGVYNNYKKFDGVWGWIGQGNRSFYTFKVLPYFSLNLISFFFIPPSLSSTYMCCSPASTIILTFTSWLLWLSTGQRTPTLSLKISVAGLFDVLKLMVLFSFQNMN